MQKNAIETQRFETPDQLLDMKERGGIFIVKMTDGSAGMHAIFEPGWTCGADEKSLLGSPDSWRHPPRQSWRPRAGLARSKPYDRA